MILTNVLKEQQAVANRARTTKDHLSVLVIRAMNLELMAKHVMMLMNVPLVQVDVIKSVPTVLALMHAHVAMDISCLVETTRLA